MKVGKTPAVEVLKFVQFWSEIREGSFVTETNHVGKDIWLISQV